MKIAKSVARSLMAGLLPAVLSGGILLFAGCDGGAQTDGELVKPTEEVENSRAAMQNQLKQNPNLYSPRKTGPKPERR